MTKPTTWIVCPDCHGQGTHALHGIALTEADLREWSEDEIDDYRTGGYDTVCETCWGRTTIPKRELADYLDAKAEARVRAYESGEWPWP